MTKIITKLILISFILSFITKAFSRRDIPDQYLSSPILITLANKSSASGFFLSTD